MKARRILLLTVTAATMLLSCKKAVQKQEENIILDAMTNGRWYVQQYKADTTDVTTEFAAYEFQFYKNGTVDGIKNTITTSGTWSSDVTSYTITAAFTTAASDTLKRLNYTWKITDSYLDYVEAKTTTANGNNILHLKKK